MQLGVVHWGGGEEMAALEDIKNGSQLWGVVPGQPVEVVKVE